MTNPIALQSFPSERKIPAITPHYIEEIAGSLKHLAESVGRLRGENEFSYAAAVQLNLKE